jgi:hypothetical protein
VSNQPTSSTKPGDTEATICMHLAGTTNRRSAPLLVIEHVSELAAVGAAAGSARVKVTRQEAGLVDLSHAGIR